MNYILTTTNVNNTYKIEKEIDDNDVKEKTLILKAIKLMCLLVEIKNGHILTKVKFRGPCVTQSVKQLPLAQVVIPGSWIKTCIGLTAG